jgi:hypothetical protein
MSWVKNSVYFYGLRPELNVDNNHVGSKAMKKSRSRALTTGFHCTSVAECYVFVFCAHYIVLIIINCLHYNAKFDTQLRVHRALNTSTMKYYYNQCKTRLKWLSVSSLQTEYLKRQELS